jgi:hypothetical protein
MNILKTLPLLLSFLSTSFVFGQAHSHISAQKKISYPDIDNYKTLSADLHIHTVFSDGTVWPSIRVQEALLEDLDVIAMTEHLEYQPHLKDLPHPDRNRSYDIALKEAASHNLIVIPGSEITRSAPVGHNNAIFISDANPLLDKEDPNTSFKEAKKQGAFVFWNHPAWYRQSSSGNPIFSDFQKKMIKQGKLHGIEVINEGAYSEEAFALALEKDLTVLGNSDVHDLVGWDYLDKHQTHRPITLIFSKDKQMNSIKEALFEGRTVAVFNNFWVGKKEFVLPLLKQSIRIENPHYIDGSEILELTLVNNSSSELLLENQMPYNFYFNPRVFSIPARGTITLQIKTLKKLDRIDLKLKSLKAYIAPKEQAVVSWEVRVD